MQTHSLISLLVMFMASGCVSTKPLIDIIRNQKEELKEVKADRDKAEKALSMVKTEKADVEKNLADEHAKVEELTSELQKRQTIADLSTADLVALARSEGVSAEVRGSYVLAIINQVKVQLAYNKNKHQLFARTIFNGIDNISLVNAINRKVEFGRAYINGSSLVFEAYVDIKEGVKPKFLQHWFSTWKKHVILLKRGLIQYVQSQQAASSEM